MMLWIWAASAFAADPEVDANAFGRMPCPEITTVEDFQAAGRAGEQAFADLDLPALTRAREQALATIPCLAEPIPPQVSAEFHRMMALAAFTSGDESLVLAEFHAARRLDPGYAIPEEVAPEGHPLVLLYARAATDSGAERELEAVIPPLGGIVVVDGTANGLRPSGLSAIVQVYGEDHALTMTEYLLPGDPTPRYGPVPLELEQQKKRRQGLLAATAATAIVAGGFYGRSVAGERQFLDPNQDIPNLERAQAVNNAYFWSSVGLGSVSLGLGVFTAITW